MYGYDTAEMRPSRKLPTAVRMDEKRRACKAKYRLQELVLNKNIIVDCIGFGKYGRLLANIRLEIDDEKTVNQMMIDEGHGIEYFGGTKGIKGTKKTKKIKYVKKEKELKIN
jgi:endonuclease YncB( thermonuclease family)